MLYNNRCLEEDPFHCSLLPRISLGYPPVEIPPLKLSTMSIFDSVFNNHLNRAVRVHEITDHRTPSQSEIAHQTAEEELLRSFRDEFSTIDCRGGNTFSSYTAGSFSSIFTYLEDAELCDENANFQPTEVGVRLTNSSTESACDVGDYDILIISVPLLETLPTNKWSCTSLNRWGCLPENPLSGMLGGKLVLIPPNFDISSNCPEKQHVLSLAPSPLHREDFKYYCEPCQKGYYSEKKLEYHLNEEHIYCPYRNQGCNFTCRTTKAWKMELHVTALHNHPDAPKDLTNTKSYIEARRNKYPTQLQIKSRCESLFYQAARGEILPEERRRWLKHHGVFVSKKPWVPVARNDDPETMAHRAAHRSDVLSRIKEAEEKQLELQNEKEKNSADEADEVGNTGKSNEQGRGVVQTILPLGANGRYTRIQLVQMVKDKYRSASTVPRFYVCNRCGAKGQHWVANCPTGGDKIFDAHQTWAVMPSDKKKEKPSENTGKRESTEKPVQDEVNGVAEPPKQEKLARKRSRSPDSTQQMHHRPGLPQPKGNRLDVAKSNRHYVAPPPPPPSLFDRLTENQRINERGLLLQALRYFVRENFLQP